VPLPPRRVASLTPARAALLPRQDNSTCVLGQLECFGTCVDPQTDNSHCGACRSWCVAEAGRPASSCVAGTCMCPDGPACPWSSGPGWFCPDLATNLNNCGACGVVVSLPPSPSLLGCSIISAD
jgi:hypothetical protein